MLNFFKVRLLGLGIAAIWFLLDYYSKYLAVLHIKHEVIPVIPNLFNLRLAFNRGVSFSMLRDVAAENLPYMLGGMAFSVAFFLVYWLGKSSTKLFTIGVSGVMGGAVGNGLDRFTYGAVVDFLDFYYGNYHWPTFNIADTAIFIGVVCLLLDSFINNEEQKINEHKNEKN